MKHRAAQPATSRLVLAFATVLMLVVGPAVATQQGTVAIANWKQADNCARWAQAAFPDFTADSNAKRDAALKQCLQGGNLPPRQPETPVQSR